MLQVCSIKYHSAGYPRIFTSADNAAITGLNLFSTIRSTHKVSRQKKVKHFRDITVNIVVEVNAFHAILNAYETFILQTTVLSSGEP